MRCNRVLALAALAVLISGCAASEELQTWSGHGAHFASMKHMAFSLRQSAGGQLTVTEADRAEAQGEGWWGMLVPSTATPAPPPADISGEWRGVWRGVDAFDFPRFATADATFSQGGSTGKGWLRLDETNATPLPAIIRIEGSMGVDVVYTVRGGDVTVKAGNGDKSMRVELTLVGNDLVGKITGGDTPVSIVLTRLTPTKPLD
jgi:hypothetical protein